MLFEKFEIAKYLKKTGVYFDKVFKKLCDELNLKFQNNGLITVPIISYNSGKSELDKKIKTYITQEMLKKGYLAATAVYVCTAHTPEIIKEYFPDCDENKNLVSSLLNALLALTDLESGDFC